MAGIRLCSAVVVVGVVLCASSARADDPPPLPTPTATPAPASPAPTGPIVHIEGADKAKLWRVDGGRSIEACAAPCDAQVPPGDYEVRGPGLSNKPIKIQNTPGGRVDVHVSPPNKPLMYGGAAVAGIGVIAMLMGTVNLVFSTLGADGECNQYNSVCKDNADEVRTVGLIFFGAGAAALALGGVAFIWGFPTDVKTREGQPSSPPPPPPTASAAAVATRGCSLGGAGVMCKW